VHGRTFLQHLAHHGLHHRVQVHRASDLHVAAPGQHGKRLAHAMETAVEIPSPVSGDQDQPPRRIKPRELTYK
jgi:hypothetical protein